MEKTTMGTKISSLRKAKGMTQQELADVMNVTDKAVSKWERDLSCPDVNTLPKLAECLGVSVGELLQSKQVPAASGPSSPRELIETVFRVIPLAMGIAVTVLSLQHQISAESAITLLGLGMACAGIVLVGNRK